MAFEPTALAVILAAGVLAGVMNALAGGGSFLTLPALVFVGLPPIMANATGTFAQLPGYVSTAWALRRMIRRLPALGVRGVLGLSLAGGGIGATLLLVTSNQAFAAIVPWLLLFATLAFALAPAILRRLAARGGGGAGPLLSLAAVLLATAYGGYFNGGLGIILMALFLLLGEPDIVAANGLKSLVSAVLTAVSVVIYALGGLVDWAALVPMALASTAGGVLGARLQARMPQAVLRRVVILIGAALTVVFFIRT